MDVAAVGQAIARARKLFVTSDGVDARVAVSNLVKPQSQDGARGYGKGTGYPSFTLNPDTGVATPNPVFTWGQTGQNALTITRPTLIEAGAFISTPTNEHWRLYYSTDHQSSPTGTDGIYVATGPTPYGPWTARSDYGTAGKIWDDTSANQTEMPSVIYNPTTSLFHMYYVAKIDAGDVQTTRLVTSVDGITSWSTPKTVIIVPYVGANPGLNYNGYLRVHRYANSFYGYHLSGGGNYSYYGISRSLDGIRWVTDPRGVAPGRQWLPSAATDPTQIVGAKWANALFFEYRGATWSLVPVGTAAAGGDNVPHEWYVGPMRDDMRGWRAAPIKVTPPFQTWEASNRHQQMSCAAYGSQLVVMYRGVGTTGGFGIATLDL